MRVKKEDWPVFVLAALGLLLALLILQHRNIYEDEWLSLNVMHMPLAELWRWGNVHDIHPPGMLALDRLALLALGGARRIAAVHLLVWLAGVLAFVLAARDLVRTAWGRLVFTTLSFLHPQALTWDNSIRWYPVWWGIALAMVAVGLLPRRRSPPGWAVTLGLGVVFAALIYLDYLALVFIPSFAVAWLVRYGFSRASVTRVIAMSALPALLAAPQIAQFRNEFLLHAHVHLSQPLTASQLSQMMKEAPPQTPSRVPTSLVTFLRVVYGLSIGGAILPWRPVAIVVGLMLIVPCTLLLIPALPRRWRELGAADPPEHRTLAALVTLATLIVAAAVPSGIGNHSYSLLGMVPFAALLLAFGAEQVEARWWRVLVLGIAAVWIGLGAHNLITRSGISKRQLNARPEAVIARLETLAGGRPALVVTNDLILTFEINQRRARKVTPLVVASCWDDRIHGFPAGLHDDPGRLAMVFEVEHPEGDWDAPGAMSRQALILARGLIDQPRTEDLGIDRDWQWKRRIPRAALQRATLRVYYGRPRPGDWAAIDRLMQQAAGLTILGGHGSG